MTRLSDVEREALTRWVKGGTAEMIAMGMDLRNSVVERILDKAGGDKARARQLLAEDAAASTPPTIEQLLAAGEASDQPRVRALAAKIRAQLAALQTAMHDAEAARQVKERIAKLEAELAQLRGKAPANARTGPAAGTIRAWAKENGLYCPPVGRVPRDVAEAHAKAVK